MTSIADLDLLAAADRRLAATDDLALARATIAAVDLPDDAVRAHRERMLAFVDVHADALHRSCAEGHLTGSALVVDPRTERILLLFHAKVRRWLQPGGHADGDANLAAVALREAWEETGIEGLRVHPVPIDLDVHRFRAPGEDDHDHLDVRFLVVAPADAVVATNHESEGARWVTIEEMAQHGTDPGTVRMARAGLARLARR